MPPYSARLARMSARRWSTQPRVVMPSSGVWRHQSISLATVVRASVDKAVLGKTLQLKPEQKIVLAQSVGYPR